MSDREDFLRYRQTPPGPDRPPGPPGGWTGPPRKPPTATARFPPTAAVSAGTAVSTGTAVSAGATPSSRARPRPSCSVPPARRPARSPPAGGAGSSIGDIRPDQPRSVRRSNARRRLRVRDPAPLRGYYKVGVLGKGGVGKTSVAASVGSVFAELRPADRVVAVDADTAFGRLGSRIDPTVHGSYWEIAADRNMQTFADLQPGRRNNVPGCTSWPANRRQPADGSWTPPSTAKLPCCWTGTSPSRSSTAGHDGCAGHPGGAARPRRADRGVLTLGRRGIAPPPRPWSGWPTMA